MPLSIWRQHFAGLDWSSLENLRAYLLRCVVSRAINAYHMRRRESSYDEYVELQETDLGIRSGSAEDVMLDAVADERHDGKR